MLCSCVLTVFEFYVSHVPMPFLPCICYARNHISVARCICMVAAFFCMQLPCCCKFGSLFLILPGIWLGLWQGRDLLEGPPRTNHQQ